MLPSLRVYGLPPGPAKKSETRVRQSKASHSKLEDFLDWTRLVDSDPAEKEEMFSLATRFSTQRRRRPATLEGVATSSFRKKRPRRSPSDEEAQKVWAIVLVESPDLASNDQPTLEVCLNEANMPLEGEVPAMSPTSIEEVGMGAPLGVVISPVPSPKPIASDQARNGYPTKCW